MANEPTQEDRDEKIIRRIDNDYKARGMRPPRPNINAQVRQRAEEARKKKNSKAIGKPKYQEGQQVEYDTMGTGNHLPGRILSVERHHDESEPNPNKSRGYRVVVVKDNNAGFTTTHEDDQNLRAIKSLRMRIRAKATPETWNDVVRRARERQGNEEANRQHEENQENSRLIDECVRNNAIQRDERQREEEGKKSIRVKKKAINKPFSDALRNEYLAGVRQGHTRPNSIRDADRIIAQRIDDGELQVDEEDIEDSGNHAFKRIRGIKLIKIGCSKLLRGKCGCEQCNH